MLHLQISNQAGLHKTERFMEKTYEIKAYAKNTTFHRTADFTLTGDNDWRSSSLTDGREYRNEADAIACFDAYATQAQANDFTAHTDVTFELIESAIDAEEEITARSLKSASFKVAIAA